MYFLQPTAWDVPPVPDPDNCPPPSERHKQMYKQYEEDVKSAYKNKDKNEFTEVSLNVLFHHLGNAMFWIILSFFSLGFDVTPTAGILR